MLASYRSATSTTSPPMRYSGSKPLRFQLGRRYGRAWVAGKPALAAKVGRVTAWLDRYPNAIILGFRFVYGVRNTAPMAIALAGVPPARFAVLNAAAALIWATVGASAGYLFGNAVEAMLGDLRRIEEQLLAAAVLAAVLCLAYRFVRSRRARRG